MAKSFKNLPRPGESASSQKPASERDFFDLTDEPVSNSIPVKKAKKTSNTSNKGNTNNNSNTGNIGNTDVTRLLVEPDASGATGRDVRQTFVLSSAHLEQLRDYVHVQRAMGNYLYSQKQALQEALELLFATAEPAPPRPAHAREQEQQRRQRIQQGRRSTNG